MKAWRELKGLPRELWILSLASFVNRLGTMALPFLVLYLTRSLGFSGARAGLVLAVYGGVALLVGPVAGRLSDRLGALRTMETALVSSGVILLLFPLARGWAQVLIMTALLALTNESFRPANLTLVGELSPPHLRKSAFALGRLAVNLGMSFGPALGGFLAQVSFPSLFLVDGISTLAAASILIFSAFHASVDAREKQNSAARAADLPPTAPPRGIFLPQALFSDPALRAFLLGILPVAIVFFQHQAAMPLFLVRDLHFSESAYGLLFTINTGMIITLEIPLNSATSSWSHRRTLALGSALFATGFGALALARTYFEVALTVVVWTTGEMILFPGMSAYVSELAPEGRRGEYMGLYMMAFSLAFMAGPWLGTVALDRFGPTALWTGALAVGLLSTALLGSIRVVGRD